MSGSEPLDELRVDVIDEQGRVVDTVYVGEISGKSRKDDTPPPSLRGNRRPD